MKLSVIMLVYDETFEHIKKNVCNLPANDCEIILVDNRVDRKWDIHSCCDYRHKITVVGVSNIGTFYGRKLGFRHSHGDYIWNVNGDDDILETCAPNIMALCDLGGNVEHLHYSKVNLSTNWFSIWKRENLEQVYRYLEDYRCPTYYCEDFLLNYISKFKFNQEWLHDQRFTQCYKFDSFHWEGSYPISDIESKKSHECLKYIKGCENLCDYSVLNYLLQWDYIPDWLTDVEIERAMRNGANNPILSVFEEERYRDALKTKPRGRICDKYDVAVTMPVYKITKERLREYLKEISDVLSDLHYQVVLSNNSDMDLSEFESDIVQVVNNGGNVYAFKARKNAFYKTNARYIWSIDDDNFIRRHRSDIARHMFGLMDDRTMFVRQTKGTFESLGSCWIPSRVLKEFYDNNELKTKTYFEDVIVYNWVAKKCPLKVVDFDKMYANGSENWTTHSEINFDHFEAGFAEVLATKDDDFISDCLSNTIKSFRWSYEELLSIPKGNYDIPAPDLNNPRETLAIMWTINNLNR